MVQKSRDHQLIGSLAVYPIIYKVLGTSYLVSRISEPSTVLKKSISEGRLKPYMETSKCRSTVNRFHPVISRISQINIWVFPKNRGGYPPRILKIQIYQGVHMGVSKNWGVKPPQIMNSNRVFHYFHHPFWGGFHTTTPIGLRCVHL